MATISVSQSLSLKEQRIIDRRLFNFVENGDLKEIKRCLNEGANINARDGGGLTVLHIAVDDKNSDVVKFLLENGATSNVKNNDNETPLNIAQRLNEPSIIQLLNPQLSIRKPNQQKLEPIDEDQQKLERTDEGDQQKLELIDEGDQQKLESIDKEDQQKLEPIDEGDQQKLEPIDKEDQQKKKTVSAVHGHIYQLKLLMLFLHRGVSNQYSFRLGTEIEEAHKFDDLVFEYTECGEKKYRLLQAKHRLNRTKKITSADLLTTNNDDYSLIKYFVSYAQAKKDSFFKNGMITDVIISTNIGLDLSDLEENDVGVEEISRFDNILDTRGDSKRYMFSAKLVSKLKKKIVQKKQESIKRKQFMVGLSWRFGTKENLNWSNIVITDEEVADFLNHVVFAVNQPNEDELGEIIKDEIGLKLDLDLIQTENTYNKLFVKMLNWLQGKESGRFLSCEEGEEFFKEAKRGMPILFSIKYPVSSFTGRVEQLNKLHEALMKDDKSVVISGLGGIGKSELAKKYISLHSQDYDNKVLWMNAESFSTLSESFHRLAVDKLGICTKNVEGKEKDVKSLVEDVYRFFCKGKSIFIFDNAEKLKDGISEFLPSLPENMCKPHILITSRNQKWPSNMQVIPLDIFSETEAIEVIKKSLNVENDAETKDVEDLAKELHFFPLALQQAVAYIQLIQNEASNLGAEFKFNDYLQKYKEKTKQLLNFSFPEDSDDNYTKTTLMTWEVTLDHIKERENGDIATEVLHIIAYCEPDNIPIELFWSSEYKKKLGSAIELLKQYSMVSVEQKKLSIHRLVQQVTRMKLEEQHKEKDTLEKALSLLCSLRVPEGDNTNLKYLNHKISVWNYSSKYTDLVEEFVAVSTSICDELLKTFRFEEAYSFGIEVFALLISLSSDDTLVKLSIFATNQKIADALSNQGKYDEALKVHQLGYMLRETTFGPDHFFTLAGKSYIAQTLCDQGKYNEALCIYQEIFVVNKNILGESHSDTLFIKHEMARVLRYQGRYDEALQILQEVYKSQKATLGKDDNTTLNTKNDIADVLVKKGNHDKALEIFEEVCDIEKELFGISHPNVLSTLNRIVEVLRQLGKYDQALEICEEILHKRGDILGSDHPDVLSTLYIKACILSDKGKCCDAFQAYHEVLSKRTGILGSSHPDTLAVKSYIAQIYSKQMKHNEALQYYEDVLRIQSSTLGENHPLTLITRNNIGMVFYRIDEYDTALDIFQNVFSIEQTLFPDHFDNLTTKNNIALALGGQKKHTEALEMFQQVLDSQEAVLGKKYHKSTIFTKKNIGGQLFAMGKYNEALRVFQDAFNGLNFINGPEHFETQEIGEVLQELSARANDILTAVRNNDRKKLEDLVKEGEDVNTKDDKNTTLLHYAVNNENLEITNILMKNGADITQVTNKGNTPLHTATSKCHIEIVEGLLQHAKQLIPNQNNNFINAKTTVKGTTAIHIAAQKDNLNIVNLLLRSGAVYNIKNKENKTPSEVTLNDEIKTLFDSVEKLFEHVKRGDKKKVGQLLKRRKEIINARDSDGCTALFCAVQNGLMSTAQLLLDKGADPTLVTNKGNTPLHIASCKGKNAIVDALLSRVQMDAPENLNNFVNAQTSVGLTAALHVASNVDVAKSLLKFGAIYSIKNKEGKTPIDITENNDIKNVLSFTDKLFTTAENGIPFVGCSANEMDLFVAVVSARNHQGYTMHRVALTNRHKSIVRTS